VPMMRFLDEQEIAARAHLRCTRELGPHRRWGSVKVPDTPRFRAIFTSAAREEFPATSRSSRRRCGRKRRAC
jgi:hypothetical protein